MIFIRRVLAFLFALLLTASLLPMCAAGAALPQYQGIDVSNFQGTINFNKVRESGIDIVYIRAGNGFSADSQFKANAVNAKASGLKVGFYFSVTATTVEESKSQAAFFAALISNYSYDCRPAIDYETFSGLGASEINNIAAAFAETLQNAVDCLPLFYTDAYRAAHLWSDALTKYPLWVAEYGVSSPATIGNWQSWSGFQYTDGGRIDGISGNVDLDRFTAAVLLGGSSGDDLPFIDVSKSDWFYGDVSAVYHKNLMLGISQTQFAPFEYAERAMLVEILYRLDGKPPVKEASPFRDTAQNAWYADSVIWASSQGIAKGYGNDLFDPLAPATRQEAIVFLYRYAAARGYHVDAADSISGFKDAAEVAPWAIDAVEWAYAEKILLGNTTLTLDPCGGMTRAQAAAIIDRFVIKYS